MPLLSVSPVIYALILSELALAALKSVIASLSSTASWTLQYWHKIPDDFE